ncbi:MAG: hypothetical protein U0411_15980 [Thermodesulfovibrionales bacterium]
MRTSRSGGSQEAARANRPVEYTTDNGRGVYRAEPMGADERTNCKKVRERVCGRTTGW